MFNDDKIPYMRDVVIMSIVRPGRVQLGLGLSDYRKLVPELVPSGVSPLWQ